MHALFAQIPWQPDHQEYALILVFSGISLLVSTLSGIATIWRAFRREPSIDETLKKYASAAEVAGLEMRLIKSIDDLKEERRKDLEGLNESISALGATMNRGFNDVQRSLGRVEGKVESVSK